LIDQAKSVKTFTSKIEVKERRSKSFDNSLDQSNFTNEPLLDQIRKLIDMIEIILDKTKAMSRKVKVE
jgi:hypothetical protein